MSNPAPKQPKPKKQRQKASQNQIRIPLSKRAWGIICGIAVLVGLWAAYMEFLPRVSVSMSDPVDPDFPFSSSFTVTNSGYISLHSVSAMIGVRSIVGDDHNHLRLTEKGDKDFKSKLATTSGLWTTHSMQPEDKFTQALNDAISPEFPIAVFQEADIAIVVDYKIPIIPWELERTFPYSARRQTNGKFYWYASTSEN